MSTKWSSTAFSTKGGPNFGDLLKDEYVIVLLQGKNGFGDLIYCYLKVAFPNLDGLKAALQSTGNFNASDYGTIVASGRGDPPDEVRKEIATLYPMFEQQKPLQSNKPSALAPEKKEWDEY